MHIPGSGPILHFFLVIPAETGGICIAPRPSEEGAEILPGMAMRPFFGIVPVLMDEKVFPSYGTSCHDFPEPRFPPL